MRVTETVRISDPTHGRVTLDVGDEVPEWAEKLVPTYAVEAPSVPASRSAAPRTRAPRTTTAKKGSATKASAKKAPKTT